MEEDLALRNFLFFWGFVPLPLLPPSVLARSLSLPKSVRLFFTSCFVCLFVTKTERTPELLTNAKRKEKNRKE